MRAPSALERHTSTSERNKPDWRRFARLFILMLLGELAAIFAFLLLIDPYDSGRFPTPMPSGTSDDLADTAVVSRGRDPRFNAAIVGNSHVILLDPHRLGAASGASFVQLAVLGAGPPHQAAIIRWFARNHAAVAALVIGIDPIACARDAASRAIDRVPFWLYGSDLDYVLRIMSTRSVGRGLRRLMMALGWIPPTDAAGYVDYEVTRAASQAPPTVNRAPIDLSPARLSDVTFPGLDLIESSLESLPNDTRVVFLMPPFHISALPETDTRGWRELRTCKFELEQRIARHAKWRYLDFLLDTVETRDPRNFLDTDHYRGVIARRIETALAETLRSVEGPVLSKR